MTRARVLVVDDSAFARTVIARLLTSARIDVVGTAYDGRDALAQIAAHDPDVITLDLTMPELDGLGVLRALAGKKRPRVIVVSVSSIDTELGAEALALGAIALVAKPTALATESPQPSSTSCSRASSRYAPLPRASSPRCSRGPVARGWCWRTHRDRRRHRVAGRSTATRRADRAGVHSPLHELRGTPNRSRG